MSKNEKYAIWTLRPWRQHPAGAAGGAAGMQLRGTAGCLEKEETGGLVDGLTGEQEWEQTECLELKVGFYELLHQSLGLL